MKSSIILWGILLSLGMIGGCLGSTDGTGPEEKPEGKVDYVGLDPDLGAYQEADGGSEEQAPVEEEARWAFQCRGQARSCQFLSPSECDFSPLCESDGQCSGEPLPCHVHAGLSGCAGVDGCVWNKRSNSCMGSALPCRFSEDQTSCGAQLGCRWNERCFGPVRPCEFIDLDDCEYHAGCHLAYVKIEE